MNVNCKITLTDEQRNILYRRMTGKDVKQMVSRKEVCELVENYIEMMVSGIDPINPLNVDEPDQVELSFGSGIHDTSKWHDECCRANDLLRTRMNRLQHHIDTRI